MVSNFVYPRLDRFRNEIRLVQLLPALDRESPIACNLVHASIDDDTIRYEALSYTWGDNANPRDILLDGNPISVTPNLHTALQALRLPIHTRTLWINAVCINQKDVQERSHEVLRMRVIYERATKVVIWLGEAVPDSSLAIRHLEQLSQEFEYLVAKGVAARARRSLISLSDSLLHLLKFLLIILLVRPAVFVFLRAVAVGILEEPRWRLTSPLWILGSTFAQTCSLCLRVWVNIQVVEERWVEPDSQTVEALAEFFGRSWFSRVWVVQEIAMSRDAIVMLGPHTIPWTRLKGAYYRLRMRVSLSMCGTVYAQTRFQRLTELMHVIFRRHHLSSSLPGVRVLDLLCDLSYLEATDDRDKVYGLLGLADDLRDFDKLQGHLFEPSYDESVDKTYTRLAWFIIRASARLDVLHCVGDLDSSAGLPSWTPDWRDSTLRCGRKLRYEAFYLNTGGPQYQWRVSWRSKGF